LQTTCQRPVFFPEPLPIDQQGKTFFETQLVQLGGFQLSTEGIGHAVQFHGVQFLNRGLVQHRGCLLN